jgi:hypothetical protein
MQEGHVNGWQRAAKLVDSRPNSVPIRGQRRPSIPGEVVPLSVEV